jgi:hypothetical protein
MTLEEVIIIAASLFTTIWISLLVGISLVRKGNKSAVKMRAWLLNKRIAQFQLPPFKNMLRLWLAKRFFLTSLSFILLIITPAVLLFFLLGICLVTPLLAVYQGLVVGLLIARFERRHMAWAFIIAPFEIGYWVLAGALGMAVTVGTLLSDLSFVDSFLNAVGILLSGYWIPIVICVLVNAFGEVAGPIYWKLEGPVSLEMLAKGEPIDEAPQPSHSSVY